MSSEAPPKPHKCSNLQCKVAGTGKCLEGLTLDKCPSYGRDHHAEATLDSLALPEPVENLINLRSATSLQLPRASDLLGRHDGRVIAIVGPRDAGKTSLIASLFDLFQEGAVAGISFAGSETLHAFELACHDSRAASRRTTPVQERTGHGEVRFYHLDVTSGSPSANMTLLIGDRAGEEYRTAADDISQAGPFPEVARADTLTVLVDGGRLLNNQERHNTRSETGLMLRALADGGFLAHSPDVILALTKMDLVQASEKKDRALGDFNTVVERATPIISPFARSIEAIQIAAAPADTTLARGTGVDNLLEHWTRPTPRASLPAVLPVKAKRAILNVWMLDEVQVGVT